jgi:hypothetical protein
MLPLSSHGTKVEYGNDEAKFPWELASGVTQSPILQHEILMIWRPMKQSAIAIL